MSGLFKKDKQKALVKKDYYQQALSVLDLLKTEDVEIKTSPTYTAALHLLTSELARFSFIIENGGAFADLLLKAKAPGRFLNGQYEVLRYIYYSILDTGAAALVVYPANLIILNSKEFTISRNKNNDFTGINVGGLHIGADRVIIVNLSDSEAGGMRDWLQDVINLERYLIAYMNVYTKSYGLFGSWKLNAEDIDEKTISIFQSLLADARLKLQKGIMPVIPSELETVPKEMGWQAIGLVKDYVLKSVARVMGVPLLLLQAREQGSYALAKEERASWYETFLQGYIELVRSALEKWLRFQYNEKASVKIDSSNIDFLNREREWTVQEISVLYSQGIINEEEARRLLKLNIPAAATPRASDKAKQENFSIEKQLLREDELIHAWHSKNIQPLEAFMKRELLSQSNKVLEAWVKNTLEKSTPGIKKDIDQDKSDFIGEAFDRFDYEALKELLDKLFLNVLNKNTKRAAKRALSLFNISTYGVFIKPEDLYEGIENMNIETVKYLTEETVKLVSDKIKELRDSGKGYNWERVVIELQKAGFSQARAIKISRTEINRSCAYAHEKNNNKMELLAVERGKTLLKRWSTSADERVRPSHERAGLIGWISYGDIFPNLLSRPYDPGGAPGEVINCRCVCITKIEGEEFLKDVESLNIEKKEVEKC